MFPVLELDKTLKGWSNNVDSESLLTNGRDGMRSKVNFLHLLLLKLRHVKIAKRGFELRVILYKVVLRHFTILCKEFTYLRR